MTSAELKSDLHRFIVEINDVAILTQVREYLQNAVKTKSADWWENLSAEQQESIDKSIQQLNSGEGIPDEIVRKNINSLLEING